MNVEEAIQTMLAVRRYADRPVQREIVQRILEAGRLTASASNSQPWHFIVVESPDTLSRLGEIAQSGPYIAQAPLAIAVVIPHKVMAISDASRAIQSMMLAAWSHGVGGNWVGFWGLEAAKDLLGVPDGLDVLALLPFGYLPTPIGKGKKERKPLSEIASRERFGQPYDSRAHE